MIVLVFIVYLFALLEFGLFGVTVVDDVIIAGVNSVANFLWFFIEVFRFCCFCGLVYLFCCGLLLLLVVIFVFV